MPDHARRSIGLLELRDVAAAHLSILELVSNLLDHLLVGLEPGVDGPRIHGDVAVAHLFPGAVIEVEVIPMSVCARACLMLMYKCVNVCVDQWYVTIKIMAAAALPGFFRFCSFLNTIPNTNS